MNSVSWQIKSREKSENLTVQYLNKESNMQGINLVIYNYYI